MSFKDFLNESEFDTITINVKKDDLQQAVNEILPEAKLREDRLTAAVYLNNKPVGNWTRVYSIIVFRQERFTNKKFNELLNTVKNNPKFQYRSGSGKEVYYAYRG